MRDRRTVIGADEVRRLKVFAWCPIRNRRLSCRRMIIVRIWQRDCDHCEGDSLQAIPAGRRFLMELENEVRMGAEGPWSLTVLTVEDVKNFQPCFRDHILEAYEDGHEWSVAL